MTDIDPPPLYAAIMKRSLYAVSMKRALITARALIADRTGWTQGSWAGDGTRSVHPLDEEATCFSADGAIWRAMVGGPDINPTAFLSIPAYTAVVRILDKAARSLFGGDLMDVNEGLIADLSSPSRSHAAVLACFDLAIKDAQEWP
jgi:hypothetical protein